MNGGSGREGERESESNGDDFNSIFSLKGKSIKATLYAKNEVKKF